MADTIEKTPKYRSLVGGYFSKTPSDMSLKRSIRTNNPGALNISAWQKMFPGYVGWTVPDASPNANKTTIFETPEQGAAAWYRLMTTYYSGGYDTVGAVIDRYGGGQDYSGYLRFVLQHEPSFTEDTRLDLNNEQMLLKLLKVMARHEAGVPIPWSDQQLLYGIKLGREYAGGPKAPAPAPAPQVPTATTTVTETGAGFWVALIQLIARLFGGGSKKVTTTRILKMGSVGADVRALQERLRELGFVDVLIDGEFGTVTDKAIRTFQERENLDPDGQVGELTLLALNQPGAHPAKPPLMPPPLVQGGAVQTRPPWYTAAEKEIGYKETGNNRGIERYIGPAKTGSLGDPWCAIFINAMLEGSGVPGSRSPAARSFVSHPKFVKLKEPALGAIVPMWRDSPGGWQGHVFFYDGESPKGIRGIGGNEDNMVKRSFHDRSRVLGYYWPKSLPLPTSGKILVSDSGAVVSRSET